MEPTPNFLDCVHVTLGIEKGYVNNPNDTGKATNLGITIGLLSEWSGKQCTDDDVKNLTVAEALKLYQELFWEPCECEEMPKPVALVVFDAAVNSGQGRAIKWLQYAIGVIADGVVGPNTLSRLHAVKDLKQVIDDATESRLEFLQARINWNDFKNGWQSRINLVRDTATTWSMQ